MVDVITDSSPTLVDLSPLRVTARTAEKLIKPFGINEQTVKDLPQKAVVVEIGSGLFQEFAGWVKLIRPDIVTISIDPTLALRQEDLNKPYLKLSSTPKDKLGFLPYVDGQMRQDEVTYKALGEEPHAYTDKDDKFVDLERIAKGLDIHNRRVATASKNGGVAAIVPSIPLANESSDLLIDSFGVGTWYCEGDKETKNYFDEVLRVMKPGSSAYIFPIDTYSDFVTNIDDNTRNEKARLKLTKYLLGKTNISVTFITYEINGENKRIGIILKKEFLNKG